MSMLPVSSDVVRSKGPGESAKFVQNCQGLRCSHTQSIDVDKATDKILNI